MDNYLGEIRIFPSNTIPKGWVACNGQSLPMRQNAALYSLLGIFYGGDGINNFNLPNLNGRTIVGTGRNPVSGTIYNAGNSGGLEQVELTPANLPSHTHAVGAYTAYNNFAPATNFLGNPTQPADPSQTKKNTGSPYYYNNGSNAADLIDFPANTVSNEGDGAGHENRMPFVALVYCIATLGLYPPRP